MLRDATRKFLAAENALGALRARIEDPEPTDVAQWRAGAELGWSSMLVPEKLGGGSVTDQPLVDLAVLAEEMGRVLHPAPFLPTNVVADALARTGGSAGPGQPAEALLRRIAAGSMAAWCLSADGTDEPSAIGVAARRSGQSVVLDGVARYVHGASCAEFLMVATTADANGRPGHFVVPASAPGVLIRVMVGLDLTRRLCEVRFEDVDVPVESRLDRPGSPHADSMWKRCLAVATVVQAAEALGGADRLVTETVAYAKDRVQFGRPIGSFQAIKHRLADLLVEIEGMRAAVYYAALTLGDGAPDADEAVAVAGAWCAEAYARVCGEALQLHGGIGFTWEHDVHLYLRGQGQTELLYGEPWQHRERLCQLLEADRCEKGGAV